ncbi:hypothetical protein AAFF_G00146170 [Aldrovandia affinis]|uniref:Uncharacterized protein n=1 Tax=Aldrovandia affinis TaxID=143900 RepID=A0AAD7RPP1_9TELE|nr:hypothetical protein AAFF_G00146170 [Aldrovandia affinis]
MALLLLACVPMSGLWRVTEVKERGCEITQPQALLFASSARPTGRQGIHLTGSAGTRETISRSPWGWRWCCPRGRGRGGNEALMHSSHLTALKAHGVQGHI